MSVSMKDSQFTSIRMLKDHTNYCRPKAMTSIVICSLIKYGSFLILTLSFPITPIISSAEAQLNTHPLTVKDISFHRFRPEILFVN